MLINFDPTEANAAEAARIAFLQNEIDLINEKIAELQASIEDWESRTYSKKGRGQWTSDDGAVTMSHYQINVRRRYRRLQTLSREIDELKANRQMLENRIVDRELDNRIK